MYFIFLKNPNNKFSGTPPRPREVKDTLEDERPGQNRVSDRGLESRAEYYVRNLEKQMEPL